MPPTRFLLFANKKSSTPVDKAVGDNPALKKQSTVGIITAWPVVIALDEAEVLLIESDCDCPPPLANTE